MQAYEIISEYYDKYKNDTEGCVTDFLNNYHGKRRMETKIRKVAIYYPVMNRGGVQRVISLLLPIYEKLSCEIILITEKISGEDYFIPEYVKRVVITSEMHALMDRDSFRKRYKELEDILSTELVDLFLHHGVRQQLFVYDIMLAKTAGIYTVAEKHQVFTQGFCDVNDLFWVHLSAFRIVDALVVLSTLEETYWRTFGINAHYIENPMNEELKKADCDGEKDSISWAGRLDVYSKQYFDILEIAAIVKRTHPEVKFRMYGSGSRAQVRELMERIEECGLQENVYFCGYETDITQMYKNTRIQLVTSAYEGFPMVVYESKILGIPLVLYELPYLELLKNKLGYISVPRGDIAGAAASICRILDNPELEKKLCDDAKMSIQEFSNEKVGQKWERLFCNIKNHVYCDEKNDKYGMILKTMHSHYAIAQKKYERLMWDSQQAVLSFLVRKGLQNCRELVICPFGKIGKRVKKMLNEKGVQEAFIVDNGLAKIYPGIISMERLKKLDCSNYFFVICCEDEELKKEFRRQLRALCSDCNIINYDTKLDEMEQGCFIK